MIDNPDFSLVWNNLGNVQAISVLGMPKTLGIWEWGCLKRGDAHITVTPPSNNWALGTRLYFYVIQPDSVIIRLEDVKVLKSRWNFVKTETTTPGNNIYTLLINFIAFTSFISSKFQTLFSHTNSHITPQVRHITLGPPVEGGGDVCTQAMK